MTFYLETDQDSDIMDRFTSLIRIIIISTLHMRERGGMIRFDKSGRGIVMA